MALAQRKLDSSTLETTVHLQQEQPACSPNSPVPESDLPGMGEVDYESLPTEKLSTHLCAGAAAGMMEHCAMYPVDCVKVCVCVPCGLWEGMCVSCCTISTLLK